jgi:hypothetical protein
MNSSIPPMPSVRALSIPVLALIVMAGTWALLIAVIRWPMGTPLGWSTLEVFVLAGAVMLTWREGSSRVLSGQWSSYAFVLLATLAVLFSPALVWVLGRATTPVLSVVLAFVWIVGLRGLIRDCRHESVWQIAAAVLGGAALGFTYFLYVNTKSYGSVFSPEQILLGTQHPDTMFHASLAGMIGRFRMPATGLDGLVRIHYHFLSHTLIGVTGRSIGIAPIDAYYLVHQVLNLPLLFFSLTAATFWLWRPDRTAAGGLLALLVPLLLLLTFERWDWGSYLVSESYALSLSLLLLTLPLVMELHERPQIGRPLVRYVALAIAGLAIMLTKNSVGMLFACAVLYAVVRSNGLTPKRLIVAIISVAVLGAIGLRLTMSSAYSNQSPIEWLHFVHAYPDAAWPNIWTIVVLLIPGVWVWARNDGQRRVQVEVLGVLALGSLVAGLVLRIGAGAAYYFLNVGVWMAIVIAAGGFLLPRLAAARWQPAMTAVMIALVAAVILFSPDKRQAGSRLIALASTIDGRVQDLNGVTPVTSDASTGLFAFLSPNDSIRRRIADGIRRTPGGLLHARLMAAATAGTRVDAVYVPPTDTAFWRMQKLCTAAPFFVPALSSLPMVLGLPPDKAECPVSAETGYGFSDNPEPSRSVSLSDVSLCETLRRDGFRTALVLESPDASRVVTCR